VIQPQKMTATDENGRFRFERICKGAVGLQANVSTSAQGSGTARAEAGRQDVKIVLYPSAPGEMMMRGAGIGRTSAMPAYKSLVGKRLTEVGDLKTLLPPDTDGKPVLILFLDQQQRPSRNVALTLAKMADSLNQRGVVPAGIQVGKMERAALDQWVRDQKMPFQVQTLEGDFEKQRSTWGVKALPWLVLTDKDHVVRAEGFAVSELEAKLKDLAGGN
jgi:hypothetical protein